MPFYDILCSEHGKQEAFSRDPAELVCPICNKGAKRLWTAPASHRLDFKDGWDMGAGRNFSTARERNNWLAEKNWRRIKD